MAGKEMMKQVASKVVEEVVQQPQKVDFIVWWALNEKKIPSHHHKEIIKADFKARGLSDMESMEDFSEALKKYGLDII
jgi:hypothetical protein